MGLICHCRVGDDVCELHQAAKVFLAGSPQDAAIQGAQNLPTPLAHVGGGLMGVGCGRRLRMGREASIFLEPLFACQQMASETFTNILLDIHTPTS